MDVGFVGGESEMRMDISPILRRPEGAQISGASGGGNPMRVAPIPAIATGVYIMLPSQFVVAGICAAMLMLTGCATVESVEHAQATADAAMSHAQAAGSAAGHAQSTADEAMRRADFAGSKADRAEAHASMVEAKLDRLIAMHKAHMHRYHRYRRVRGERD